MKWSWREHFILICSWEGLIFSFVVFLSTQEHVQNHFVFCLCTWIFVFFLCIFECMIFISIVSQHALLSLLATNHFLLSMKPLRDTKRLYCCFSVLPPFLFYLNTHRKWWIAGVPSPHTLPYSQLPHHHHQCHRSADCTALINLRLTSWVWFKLLGHCQI